MSVHRVITHSIPDSAAFRDITHVVEPGDLPLLFRRMPLCLPWRPRDSQSRRHRWRREHRDPRELSRPPRRAGGHLRTSPPYATRLLAFPACPQTHIYDNVRLAISSEV